MRNTGYKLVLNEIRVCHVLAGIKSISNDNMYNNWLKKF